MPTRGSRTFAPLMFALLVAATIGAFFLAQRLKGSEAVVQRVFVGRYISPNDDGRRDLATVRFFLPEADDVSVSILDGRGETVRRLADDQALPRGVHKFRWDGRDGEGQRLQEGLYRPRVSLRSKGRSLTLPRTVLLDVTPPRPQLLSVAPRTIAPGGRVRARYTGSTNPPALFTVYRTDGPAPRVAARFRGTRFRNTASWDGRVRGIPAPEGSYALAVTVLDKARNPGNSPPSLPPTRLTSRAHTGVTVSGLRAAGPLEPVRAGGVARVRVGPVAQSFRWRLTRIGSRKALRRGDGRGRRLAFRVPRRARAGLHVVRVEAAGRRVLVPLAVSGRARRRLLVVLPAITWQGANAVDGDDDGFPDTLEDSPAVRLDRPFAAGRLPAGVSSQIAPLQRRLDRTKARYDLTTDLALARGRGPRLNGHAGVLFPGDQRWITPELERRIRSFVEGGGSLASFGRDSFRRRVTLEASTLTGPTRPAAVNALGETTVLGPATGAEDPLLVRADRIGLFAGTGGALAGFPSLEESEGLAAGARRAAAAGRADGGPAIVAYRLGRGLVVRVGARGFARRLGAPAPDPDAQRVTARILRLLSRRSNGG